MNSLPSMLSSRLKMPEQASISARDDGLYYDTVGGWAEDKHKLVQLYEHLFSTGMKNKWDERICIDLYSGSGLARIRDTNRFVCGSPILALSAKDSRYIFCEENSAALTALKTRVAKSFPDRTVSFVEGDCNAKVEEVCNHIPTGGALTFCLADPYDLSIRFSTVSRIAEYRTDFLILLALYMDANRNEANYLAPENRKIDDFLGVPDWRERWKHRSADIKFPRFLAEEYAKQMEGLGYLPVPFARMKQVRSDVRNLPLYHLALFSRHELAYHYWDQVLKYSSTQTSFW